MIKVFFYFCKLSVMILISFFWLPRTHPSLYHYSCSCHLVDPPTTLVIHYLPLVDSVTVTSTSYRPYLIETTVPFSHFLLSVQRPKPSTYLGLDNLTRFFSYFSFSKILLYTRFNLNRFEVNLSLLVKHKVPSFIVWFLQIIRWPIHSDSFINYQ